MSKGKIAYVTGGMGGIGTSLCQRLHRRLLRDVDVESERGIPERGGCPGRGREIAIRDDDARTFRDECARNGGADSRCGACDDRDASFEPAHRQAISCNCG